MEWRQLNVRAMRDLGGTSFVVGILCLATVLAPGPAAAQVAEPAAALDGDAPDTPEELFELAERHERDGLLRQAKSEYELFIQKYAEHVRVVDARYRLAVCTDNIGDPEGAMTLLRRVLEDSKETRFRHRSDAFMHLARLLGEAGKEEESVEVLDAMIEEGAGLYEAEAYDKCASYHALLGNYEKAAALFNILKRKPDKKMAALAAYKLAVVWIQADQVDLAKGAVDEFAEQYPEDGRVPELYLRVARYYYDKQDYQPVLAICQQVIGRYPRTVEGMEAAYMAALVNKAQGDFKKAAAAMMAIGRMEKADRTVALEAVFQAAQIYHKDLNDIEQAIEYYRLAADASRNAEAGRAREVHEYATFQIAEYYYRNEKWAAALDMYVMLQRMGTKANLIGRIISCQTKLSPDGAISLSAQTEEEIAFLKSRIAQNPGTLLAAQLEAFLLDMKLRPLLAAKSGVAPWSRLEPVARDYEGMFSRYQLSVLEQGDLVSTIYYQMGRCHALATGPTDAATRALRQQGLKLFEKALAVNPESLSRTSVLEAIAASAKALGDNKKAFEAYRDLYALIGAEPRDQDPEAAADAQREEKERLRAESYLRGMVALADTPNMLAEAMTEVGRIIEEESDPASDRARNARFYRAELFVQMRRYSDAAGQYREFVRMYGPQQDKNGQVLPHLRDQKTVDAKLRQVYEAGIRMARCWFYQHHAKNMLRDYAWITTNQVAGNMHLAEAWYYVANSIGKKASEKEKPILLKRKAETLWRELVNRSMDFGSRSYGENFRPWIQGGHVSRLAKRYVESALLKAGEIYADLGDHDIAASIFRQHLALTVAPRTGETHSGQPLGGHDIARYALGRELIQLQDIEGMAGVYRVYVDGLRGDRFRASALMLLGHYGTQAELFGDAQQAYAALLDEYGPPNPVDRKGLPIPVPVAARLRPAAKWNGVRDPPPPNWDEGKIRYSLGFAYYKQEDWQKSVLTLTPFSENEALKPNESRPTALFLLGRAHANQGDDAAAVKALSMLLAEYPEFDGAEDAHVDLIRSAYLADNWDLVDRLQVEFANKYPTAARQAYMDLYQALGDLRRGRVAQAITKLRSIARADTYEDIKADAYYHLGLMCLEAKPPEYRKALQDFDKSLELYPRELTLLDAAKGAIGLKDWTRARTYLDRAIREFPRGDPDVLNEAKAMIRRVMKLEAIGKRG